MLCGRIFHTSRDFGGLTKPHTSVHSPGIAPGPHNGGRPGGTGKSVSANASSKTLVSWGLFHFDWRQADPLKSPATKSTCSSCFLRGLCGETSSRCHSFWHNCCLCGETTVKDFWPLRGCQRKAALETKSGAKGCCWCCAHHHHRQARS